MKPITTLAIGAVLAASTALIAQTTPMRPGKYETTSQFAMGGRAVNMPARRDATCVTDADLKDWSKNVAKTAAGTKCTRSEYKPDGRNLVFTEACTDADGTHQTIKGNVTFTPPDVYHAVITIKSDDKRDDSPFAAGMTITVDGKRIGDCTK